MGVKEPEPPHDGEHFASLKGLGQAVTFFREQHGMSCEEVARPSEMSVQELEAIERGELHERWGGLRKIAEAIGIPLGTLLRKAEEIAPGPGGEKWRRKLSEADRAARRRKRGDGAEGGQQA